MSYSDINNNNIIENNEILSETDYYPFGLQHTENSIATTANKAAEKYQYNGKEFQDELNLNVTAMDFRMYDNALGRFYGIDKLSEVTPGITPFHFGYNSPLLMSDPSGLLSQSFLQSLWDNSSSSGWNSWTNSGGDFFNNSGTIGINGISGERTNYEGLPNIDISPRFTARQNGILVQDHVYKTAGGYQYFRDGLREKSLDNLQNSLDVIGMVPALGEVADLINSGISYGRGDYVGASLSLAATVPFIGVGATVAKAGRTAALAKFYPANNGFLGTVDRTFLMPGQEISRFGSNLGKFFSPSGTPLSMRALPPGANTSIHNTFKVLKPFEVQVGKIAPAFGQPGLGTQYLSPISVDVLLKRGIIGY